jgi:hypothetical protein
MSTPSNVLRERIPQAVRPIENSGKRKRSAPVLFVSARKFLYGLSEHAHRNIVIEDIFLYLLAAGLFVARRVLYDRSCAIIAFTDVHDIMSFAVTDEIADASASSTLSKARRRSYIKY